MFNLGGSFNKSVMNVQVSLTVYTFVYASVFVCVFSQVILKSYSPAIIYLMIQRAGVLPHLQLSP